jgi:hypothetical protein
VYVVPLIASLCGCAEGVNCTVEEVYANDGRIQCRLECRGLFTQIPIVEIRDDRDELEIPFLTLPAALSRADLTLLSIVKRPRWRAIPCELVFRYKGGLEQRLGVEVVIPTRAGGREGG